MRLTRALVAGSALALALVGAVPAAAAARPDVIALPNGFAPEGITTGPGAVAYAGSLADGSIFRADLRTGEGEVFSGPVGSPSVGIDNSKRRHKSTTGTTAPRRFTTPSTKAGAPGTVTICCIGMMLFTWATSTP